MKGTDRVRGRSSLGRYNSHRAAGRAQGRPLWREDSSAEADRREQARQAEKKDSPSREKSVGAPGGKGQEG